MNPLQFFLIVVASLASRSTGIPVIGFQKNGAFSTHTYLKHKGTLGQKPNDLKELTICLRMSVHYLRGRTTNFISYSTQASSDSLTGSIERTAFDDPYRLMFCKDPFMHNECVEYVFNGFEFFKWYHICLAYSATKSDSGETLVDMKLYLNGEVVKSNRIAIKENEAYLPISRTGILILGQEQDSLGGFFDENQAFSGELSQVEAWDMILDEETIKSVASCESETAFVYSKVATWNESMDEWSKMSVDERSLSLGDLCKNSALKDYLIWSESVTYLQISDYCRRMDGILPEINSVDNLNEVHENALRRFKTAGTFYDNCAAGKDKVKFWLRDPNITSNVDVSNYDCSSVFGDRIERLACAERFPCGLCKLPSGKRLLIKGVCAKDVEYNFDFDFGVYGTKNGKPLFRGSQNSMMYFDKDTFKWRLQSLRDPLKYIQTVSRLPEDLPIGTHNWEVSEDDTMCKLRKGQILELTMSQCFPNKYTCNNGDCIDLSDKCNTEIDCVDKSDEYYCDYLKFGENYAKELIPRDESGKPLTVYMSVSVLAFPFIETVNLKFTADFFLNLKWYDLRIEYRDLNNVTALNSLSQKDQDAIWTPKLSFTNALGPFQTQVDELTSGVLIREDDSLPEDITLSTEAMLFSGRTNAIYLTREYYQDYACEFDLIYYPFDTQICKMVFEVQGKTDNYVTLAKAYHPGIEFLSSRKLVEYEIQMEAIQFKSVKNISQGIVKFVFRRNMEFHVTNTFLQTFILTCVGYFSFFFDVDNFSDRVMVVLTTMLVVATITTAIQDSLPKTSYYKLIDWWLLVSLNIMVLTIAFHTFLAHIVSRGQQRWGPNRKNSVGNSRTLLVQESRPQTASNGGRPQEDREKQLEEAALTSATRWNFIGKVFYAVLYLIFNIIFWITAITEYVRPAEEYIHSDDVFYN